jgi:hypothetical protein
VSSLGVPPACPAFSGEMLPVVEQFTAGQSVSRDRPARKDTARCALAPMRRDEITVAKLRASLAERLRAREADHSLELGVQAELEVNVDPWPTSLRTQMHPPCSSTNFLANSGQARESRDFSPGCMRVPHS